MEELMVKRGRMDHRYFDLWCFSIFYLLYKQRFAGMEMWELSGGR